MSWIILAICAAMFWGISYALVGELLKSFTMPFILLVSAVSVATYSLVAGLFMGGFSQDVQTARKMEAATGYLLASGIITICAQFFILNSIKAKNATMAAMVEVTYPVFTALFIWAFFREAQLTAGTAFGGLLILAGVACIYFFDKTVS